MSGNVPLPAAERRCVLLAGAAVLLLPGTLSATPAALEAKLKAFTGGAPLREGRVHFDIAPLVENGNTVPITVTVDSPMTAADHVREIGVFNERNPQPDVIRTRFGPLAGKAQFSARIRLATSQRLVAVAALSDGSYWSHSVDVIVTLAACVE